MTGSPHAGSAWRENVLQALKIVRAHRMRSSLLILGVAIGITTILMMVMVLDGLSRKINRDMVSASRPYLYAQKFDMLVGGADAEEQMKRRELTVEDAEALEAQCPSLDRVCYMQQSNDNYQVHYRGEKTPPTPVLGSSHTFPELYTIRVDRGRFYSRTEAHQRKRVILLGYGPARDLFKNRNPIGRFVRLAGRQYRVVGTFAPRDHIVGSLSDNFVVIPHTTYEKDLLKKTDFISIAANMREGRSLQEGEEEMVHVLRLRRGVRPGEENDFVVLSSESFLDLIHRVTVPIGIALTIIASIGLVVGGIGVMNIMLISVAERTREIGVRMAIGARKCDIQRQFLVESATLTGIGGIVGTLAGTLAAWGISSLINFPFQLSFFWTFTAVAFSGLVGVAFGLYPARRAAAMDPVNALRYE